MLNKKADIVIAVKCAPEERILRDIKKAGLGAVELYLSKAIMADLKKVIKLCRGFTFRYAIHAPSDSFEPEKLADLAKAVKAEIVVFHNTYWEDEWERIIRNFNGISANLCIENTYSIHEPLKFMRRFNLGRCLDLEHFQMECLGIYEDEFIRAINQASHIHLTGYVCGSKLWHTHIHRSAKHNFYMLGLLKKAGYSGFVVSEAKTSLQTYSEFKKLNAFYHKGRSKTS